MPFIDAAPGKAAIGLKVHRGKLYVAGGPTGAITVYDLATKQEVGTFQTPGTAASSTTSSSRDAATSTSRTRSGRRSGT